MSKKICPVCCHELRQHYETEGWGEPIKQCWAFEHPYCGGRCGCRYEPLPIDKLKAVKQVVTHKDCSDGIMSAIYLHDALPDAEIVFIYPNDVSIQAEPGMLFCDVSPPRDRVQEFVDAGAIVLDHHKHSEDIVEAFGSLGVFADEKSDPCVSGGTLAFQEVWSPLYEGGDYKTEYWAHRFSRLIGARDTWYKKEPKLWEEGCALAETLSFFSVESWLEKEDPFSEDSKDWWSARLEVGRTSVERHLKRVQRAVDEGLRVVSAKGTRVVIFPGTRLTSDAADLLAHEADLIVGFNYTGVKDGFASLIYSTRSRNGYNCGALCVSQGGGGHSLAAGFSLKFDPKVGGVGSPYETFQRILDEFESG